LSDVDLDDLGVLVIVLLLVLIAKTTRKVILRQPIPNSSFAVIDVGKIWLEIRQSRLYFSAT